MKVGSLFAGIGGADVAVHAVFPDAETVWQSDLVGEAVRARHFPGAQQLVGDVRALDPATLPRVDLLTAGFPCQDLSVAGKGAGLDGARSGLYREVLRFCGASAADLYDPDKPRVVYGGGYQPERVLIENVPALLHYLPRLSADFRALGYGLTWTVCEAADAGHPHLRRRVFVLAELDRRGRGFVEADQAGRWKPEGLRTWATPTASNPNETEDPAQWEARRALAAAKHGTNGIGEPLGQQVRPWPTPTVCGNDNREGASPTSGDGLGTAVRLWPTPRADEARTSGGRMGRDGVGESLTYAARLWPTPLHRDYKQGGGGANMRGTPPLSAVVQGRRLSPAWVEALMGYPLGWTEPEGDRIPYTPPPPVRGRYPEGWDRREPWPGFAWEPARTLPDGAPLKGRADRIRGLGNAWCPAQGALAIRTLLGERGQIALF